MLDTIKSFYGNIRAAEARAKNTAAAAEAEIAEAKRHIEALTTGLFDEEKAKLQAWLKEHEKAAS